MLKRKPDKESSDFDNILIKRKNKYIPWRLIEFKTVDHQFEISKNLKLSNAIAKGVSQKDFKRNKFSKVIHCISQTIHKVYGVWTRKVQNPPCTTYLRPALRSTIHESPRIGLVHNRSNKRTNMYIRYRLGKSFKNTIAFTCKKMCKNEDIIK